MSELTQSAAWEEASAAELAGAASATDLFVLRRIAEGRFAHVGGAGRGAGWAGIVDVLVTEESLIEAALRSGDVVRRSAATAWHVFGPYYASVVAVVPVGDAAVVVFGAEAGAALPSDPDLVELARYAVDGLVEVTPAKRLADELEALTAVKSLLNAPAGTYAESLQRLVDESTRALSCDLGYAFIRERGLLVTCDRRIREIGGAADSEAARAALAAIAANGDVPLCVQQADENELPRPFSSQDGIVAYYLLALAEPLPGILLLLHTTAARRRGFTQLCQSLGAQLVQAAQPLLTAALVRDRMGEELERTAAEARTDPLTGLSNRLAWEEAISAAPARSDMPLCIVELDCGGLKAVNDSLGHESGDKLLRRLASHLKTVVRQGDVTARLGGDEFGVLLYDADEDVAEKVVARLREAIDGSQVPGEPEIRLAVGIACRRRGADLLDAQRRADEQLLAAKRARKLEPPRLVS